MSKARGTSWELSLEPFWLAQHHDECESIFRPDGVGALQLSSARKEGDVTDDDLVGFASEHVNAGARTMSVNLGDFSGIAIHYNADGSNWRKWFLKHRSVALFVTYNCAEEDGGVEDDQVDNMLATLQAFPNAL
jgi:hypothetical protein